MRERGGGGVGEDYLGRCKALVCFLFFYSKSNIFLYSLILLNVDALN